MPKKYRTKDSIFIKWYWVICVSICRRVKPFLLVLLSYFPHANKKRDQPSDVNISKDYSSKRERDSTYAREEATDMHRGKDCKYQLLTTITNHYTTLFLLPRLWIFCDDSLSKWKFCEIHKPVSLYWINTEYYSMCRGLYDNLVLERKSKFCLSMRLSLGSHDAYIVTHSLPQVWWLLMFRNNAFWNSNSEIFIFLWAEASCLALSFDVQMCISIKS